MNAFQLLGYNNFKLYIDKETKKKKICISDWNNPKNASLIKFNDKNNNTASFLTGEVNNLTVLDFDNQASYIAFTEKYPFLLDTLIVKSPRGYHHYIEYVKEFKTGTDKVLNFPQIDILNDNKCVLAPNTSFTDLKGNKKEYKLINEAPILALNEEQINLIKKELKTDKTELKINAPIINNFNKSYNLKELVDIAHNIHLNYIDNYADWIKLVWSFSTIDEYDLSIEISKKSSKFDKKTHDKIYGENKNKNTIGTIYHYSKMSDEETFNLIKEKYKTTSDVNFDYAVDTSDYDLADLYLKLIKGDLIYFEKNIYFYKAPFWKKDENNAYVMYNIRELLSSFLKNKSKWLYKQMEEIELDDTDKRDSIKNKIDSNEKVLIAIKFVKKQKQIIEQVINLLSNREEITENIFDIKRPTVFCFKNKFFDVAKNEEVEIFKTDYITINAGYDYIDPTEEEYKQIDQIIKDIMPNKPEYECLMSILKNCLTADQAMKFIFFNGEGSNGKGWLLEFMQQLLGNNQYFVRAQKSMLTCKTSKGASEELVALNKKRLCLYSEPEEEERLNAGLLKELTDTPTIEARGLYKSLQTVSLQGCFIMECNKKPKIKGRADQALLRRVIDLYFPTIFQDTQEQCVAENDRLKNPKYKEPFFVSKHRHALFKYIMDKGKNKIYVPQSVEDRSTAYVMNNDELINWFDERYEINNNCLDVITLKSMYSNFKDSEYYRKLDKDERRTLGSKKSFEEAISKNIKFRRLYKIDYRPYINNKQVKFSTCLVGVKETNGDDDELDQGCIIGDALDN